MNRGTRNPIVARGLVVVALLVAVFPLFFAGARIWRDPEVPFLLPDGGAQWIEIARRWNLGIWETSEHIAYRTLFTVERSFPNADLKVSALRSARVYLDGILVAPPGDIAEWKHIRSVDLKDLLTPGSHELRIDVYNPHGPAVLLAYSKALGVYTGADWEASLDGTGWGPVAVAGERMPPTELAQRFPGSLAALRTLIPLYLPLFVVCFFAAFYGRPISEKYPHLGKFISRPSSIRWVLLGAWILLAVNNILKVPLDMGFDAVFHREYIGYIAEKGSLPLATEGWQMFQSPLYYLISAPLSTFLTFFFSGDNAEKMLRIIPLACGALQVEMAFRAVRHVFPERDDLQAMGTLVGGFLPMNFYISQTIGNEPLAGLLSSLAIVVLLGLISSGVVSRPRKGLVLLGVLLGLALLTKVTAVLLIPGTLLALIYAMGGQNKTVKSIALACLAVIGGAMVVSGWYYLRNWIELGKPFVGGWETSRQIVWWQDPGYRTVHDLFSFGSSMFHPIYSGLAGFWDSVYSSFWLDGFLSSIISFDMPPPWNYDFMISGALLSLLPAAGMLLGFAVTVCRAGAARPGQLFSAFCIALYFSALLYLYFTVPIYSTAKATYTVGIIPCYSIMCVTGLDLLSRNRYMSATIKALLICWAVSSYFSYLVY